MNLSNHLLCCKIGGVSILFILIWLMFSATNKRIKRNKAKNKKKTVFLNEIHFANARETIDQQTVLFATVFLNDFNTSITFDVTAPVEFAVASLFDNDLLGVVASTTA